MKRKFPITVYNPLSMAGALMASVSFGIILCMMIIEAFSHNSNPYMGIITFMVLPAFLVGGLLLIAFGVYRERKRLKTGDTSQPRLPVLDLNDGKMRNAVFFFTITTVIIIIFSAFGSYKAYEFSESDEFCGTVCHKVMSPEYTAYQLSAHSRVGCVQCHIGSGVDWFVKAKISGSYQVYSVLFNKFSRPIETPIENLRPAQETCERCHWPKHFFSQKKMVFHYYNSDETNTEASLAYLMKIGGGNGETGTEEGIHYHMNIANAVYYKTTDRARQIIPWVKIVHKDGTEETYKVKDFKQEEVRDERKMDCMDCHNRPAHVYNPAAKMINLSITRGRIKKDIPYIKAITVKAIETPYSTNDIGVDSIRQAITDFYTSNYADIYNSRKADIEAAIVEAQTIFQQNFFPFMRVSWKRYPNNRGHMYFDGCFRCHDGKHFNEKGKAITNDCNACHTIIQQSGTMAQEIKQVNLSGLDYVHPASVGNVIDQKCTDCHNKKDEPHEKNH